MSGSGGAGGEKRIHSFLSNDAEMEEGVHTGQSVLAGLAIISRGVVSSSLTGACLWTEWG